MNTGQTSGDGTADTEPAVVVDGLKKQFGSGEEAVTAVEDFSLTVDRGSVVGLLGPNGAGKTTAIKSILGMVLPDAGTAKICGFDVHENPKKAFRHVDTMLEGARNDYWRLTVRENLRYFATVGGTDPDSVAGRHDRLIEKFDLGEKADEVVRSLSRGMKQKVSVASVLASGSEVVFLDEPTLGLDIESARTLRRELRRIVDERELTVIVSSHDMDTIEAVCDRVVIMHDGRVVADDTVGAIRDRYDTRAFRVTSTDLNESHLAALRDRFDVTGTEQRGDRTSVEVATDSDEFYGVVRYLDQNDLTLETVDTVEADLEDAFIEMTGGETP